MNHFNLSLLNMQYLYMGDMFINRVVLRPVLIFSLFPLQSECGNNFHRLLYPIVASDIWLLVKNDFEYFGLFLLNNLRNSKKIIMDLKFIINSFVILLLISGCGFLDIDEKTIETRKAIFIVDPYFVEITYTFTDDSLDPIISYFLKLTDEKTNELYALLPLQIDGFSFIEGYQYRIKVLVTLYKNMIPSVESNVVITPDGYNFGGIESFELIEVLSKIEIIH